MCVCACVVVALRSVPIAFSLLPARYSGRPAGRLNAYGWIDLRLWRRCYFLSSTRTLMLTVVEVAVVVIG